MTFRVLLSSVATLMLAVTAQAGIQTITLTGGNLSEAAFTGTAADLGTATLSGAADALSGLNGLTLKSTRNSSNDYIGLTGDTGGLALLQEIGTAPPDILKNLSVGTSVQSSLESGGSGAGDTIFSNSREALLGEVTNSSGEFSANTVGYFGLEYNDVTFNYYGYGTVSFVNTASAGTGLTFGSTLFFESDADTAIVIQSGGSTGTVPEPTGLAILGLTMVGFASRRRRR